MANMKELMRLSSQDLIAMGAQVGLTFHTGMKKSHMVQQLGASAASGWMDVNAGLMTGVPEDDFGISGDASMISDAAHVAQMISSAGFTETFHEAMNGPAHHVEAVQAYMQNLGVNSDDVWLHMPKANPNIPSNHFGALNNYMRDTLSGHQDIMPSIPGHYLGDILGEYATNHGGIKASYEHLAHMYLDKSQYDSAGLYNEDAARVAHRLAGVMGPAFHEIAAVTGMASVGSKHTSSARVSYMDTLPQLGDSAIVGGVYAPRMALNASGLPLGAIGHGIRDEYSLSASLSSTAGWSDASKAIYNDVSETVKSLAKVYNGRAGLDDDYISREMTRGRGMNARHHILSERDMIMDSAARYADVSDVRSGYTNLTRDLGDDPRYSATNIRAVIDNKYDQMDAQAFAAPSGVPNPSLRLPTVAETGTAFSANLGAPTDYNSARARRESIAIANLDSETPSWDNIENSGSPIHFHNFQQGTQEWHDFRNQYDITGSMVGKYLGHAPRENSSPIKYMGEHIGLTKKTDNEYQRKLFARGHRLEAEARPRVAQQFGFDITETGAITNDNYPGMMYSPDGLIGDDAIWEHKAPNKFNDLSATPEYVDQMQMGMLLSGRSRALYSQTVGSETRSQWIDRDPDWYDRNADMIASTRGRMAAGRAFMSEHNSDEEGYVRAGRAAMTGEGVWGFQRANLGGKTYTGGKSGMSRFSADAGGDNDPFIASSPQDGYQPNFTHYTPQYPATTSGGTGNNPLAQAVKEGILGAQEENRQKRVGVDPESSGAQVDADFDDLGNPRGWSRSRIDDALGGGSGGGGGGRRGRNGSYYDDFGMAGGSIAAGIAGGSLSSAGGGVMSALSMSPWGRIAAVGIGAAQIGNELAENANESLGVAQDNGMSNPVAYASMSQGMEMMGLSEQQAGRLNATTHSAYNTMLNGDPSGAIRIVQGTRGLVTIGDIRSAQGDPVALARVIRERGAERGWSEARIAGAMQMAGLDGMARAAARNESHQVHAEAVRDAGVAADTSYAVAGTEALQSERRRASPTYAAQSTFFQNGGGIAVAGARAVGSATDAVSSAVAGARNAYEFIAGEESGNRDFDGSGQVMTSPTGARGRMQVLPSTAAKPGYGIRPSNGTLDDDARVGREYYDALLKTNNGDARKAMAAYTDGQGTVNSAVKGFGDNWLSHMPEQARNRVKAYDDWSSKSTSVQQGAEGFTRNGMSYGQVAPTINLNVVATVNNKTANATATVTGGQTVTQQINVGNGAMQKR